MFFLITTCRMLVIQIIRAANIIKYSVWEVVKTLKVTDRSVNGEGGGGQHPVRNPIFVICILKKNWINMTILDLLICISKYYKKIYFLLRQKSAKKRFLPFWGGGSIIFFDAFPKPISL